jgi:opacity protein-like surface antigen
MNQRLISAIFFIALSPLMQAQPLTEHHGPKGENVRLAFAIDADGGVNGDEWKGIEVAYASKIYPLDQLLISYAHHDRDGNFKDTVMVAIEEYYPLTELLSPYGVAGIGYMWSDLKDGVSADKNSVFGKLGAGLVFKFNHSVHLYGEFAYVASDKNLWLDGRDSAKSNNWQALLGFRFNY